MSLFIYIFFACVPTDQVNVEVKELLLANCSVYSHWNCRLSSNLIFLFLFLVYIGIGVAAGIILIVVVLVVAYFVMKNKK